MLQIHLLDEGNEYPESFSVTLNKAVCMHTLQVFTVSYSIFNHTSLCLAVCCRFELEADEGMLILFDALS